MIQRIGENYYQYKLFIYTIQALLGVEDSDTDYINYIDNYLIEGI